MVKSSAYGIVMLKLFITVSFIFFHIQIIAASPTPTKHDIIVFGSLNIDTILPLAHLPVDGENLMLLPDKHPTTNIPGGKGCNQAIACSKLRRHEETANTFFVGKFGNDKDARMILKNALLSNKVDISYCETCKNVPSGRGYVFLQKDTGAVSAVVSGGSNLYGWGEYNPDDDDIPVIDDEYLDSLLFGEDKAFKCILLQREIPEYVNYRLASHINNRKKRGHETRVLLDVGGEDRPISKEMLGLCDYIIPNKSELKRLVCSLAGKNVSDESNCDKLERHEIISLAKTLQRFGAKNVLVTSGSSGSVLIQEDGNIIEQDVFDLPEGCEVVDETGAGDCYRAGFAVALSEENDIGFCMKFASAAGALAVCTEGAVPSIPTRADVDLLISQNKIKGNSHLSSKIATEIDRGGNNDIEIQEETDSFPYMFGSRLNSMKDRPDLWPNGTLQNNVKEWVKRQATVKGLGCVDFNYPQHFLTWTAKEAKEALNAVHLVAGAVCLRYPTKFARGAFNHPDKELREEAINLTREAAEAARELGCDEVVVWSAYDGYDYPFQVNYEDKWNQIVMSFKKLCDDFPDIKWSLEFKPTDENTRFFTVCSTGAAMLLVNQIDRSNMGLTLDVGHMLMAGENPAQSISMVGSKLFGIQLNDGYTRLAAEDGLMFASIHPTMALEIMYTLKQIQFKGHLYFDTFPQRSDPVKEAEYNIEKVKELYEAANRLDEERLRSIMDDHDAIGALRAIDDAMKFPNK